MPTTRSAPAGRVVVFTDLDGTLLRHEDYDWSADIGKIIAPTQLVYGDWDAVRTSHVASFFELLGGGKQDANWDGSGMKSQSVA